MKVEKITFESNILKNRGYYSFLSSNIHEQSFQQNDLDLSSRGFVNKEEDINKKSLNPNIKSPHSQLKKWATQKKEQQIENSKKRVQFCLVDEMLNNDFGDSFFLDESYSSINESSSIENEHEESKVEEESKVWEIRENAILVEKNF